ncbi:Nn.00g044050.m01.CDS01 [Neocucurbitaria sp. VM-36]
MESTTSSTTNTHTPVRRISRKAHHKSELSEPEMQSEKTTTNESPFHNTSNASLQRSDQTCHSTKEFISNVRTTSESDIEAQDKSHPTKSHWRQRLVAYLVLFIAIFVWLMLIVGVLVLTDNFLPGALRSYHMLKDMGVELANVRFEVAGLKAQVGTLWQYVNGMRSVEKGEE